MLNVFKAQNLLAVQKYTGRFATPFGRNELGGFVPPISLKIRGLYGLKIASLPSGRGMTEPGPAIISELFLARSFIIAILKHSCILYFQKIIYASLTDRS